MAKPKDYKNINKLPLTLDQKRLWVISKQDNKNPAYNLTMTYQIEGPVDIDIFNKALQILFNRHYILFSVFKSESKIPIIQINRNIVSVKYIDFSNLPAQQSKNQILEFFAKDSRTPFDIEKGPLYRLYLLKYDNNNYYFHATIHHLVFDGKSMSLFIRELEENYNSLSADKHPEIYQHPISYDNVFNLSSTDLVRDEKELIKFWKEYLEGHNGILNFPYDHPRDDHNSGFGGKVPFSFSDNLSRKLKKLSMEGNSSLFKTILSLLAILLGKYTGDEDICIGFPVSTRRKYPGSEELLGLFVNTSVARLKINVEQSIIDYVRESGYDVNKSIKNSDLPFDRIVEAVNPQRNFNINPFFQVALSWWEDVNIPIQLNSSPAKRVHIPQGVSPFDMTWYMWEDNEKIEGEIEYNIDILEYDTILRLRDNFIHLIELAVDDPHQLIKEISIVSESEKRKLASFNDTIVPVSSQLVQDKFEYQVKQNPSKVALIWQDKTLTYQELDTQANQLARYIVDQNIEPGEVITIYLQRSPLMIISILAVLKAGCAYLPIDPTLPEDRVRFMTMDAGSVCIITEKSLKEKCQKLGQQPTIFIDSDHEKIAHYEITKPDQELESAALAYIMYTSGSTGKPKGVRIHHKNVVNLIEGMQRVPEIDHEDKLLAVVTISFDMSVFEIFGTLSCGATMVIASTEETTNGLVLINMISKYNITLIQATPSFFNILLSHGWSGKKDLKALVGGEALTQGFVNELLPKTMELWNCYGPTEATVYATCKQITEPDEPILIGKPIQNTIIQIIDKNNKPVPIGVLGEVAISGAGLAEGYHKRPKLTRNNFILLDDGKRFYKTGDLGRFNSSGDVQLFGRIDNQIKIRGFRIEPGEIEQILTSIPNIKEAIVKVQEFGKQDKRLVAFISSGKKEIPPRNKILDTLKRHLPSYMIPYHFHILDDFPRLPNGKINRQALFFSTPEHEEKENNTEHVLTNTEKIIYDIWKEVLKIGDFNKTDNFFDIGGNSLLAIKVFSKITDTFNVQLTLRTFFDNPNIMHIAEIINLKSKNVIRKDSYKKNNANDKRIIEGEL